MNNIENEILEIEENLENSIETIISETDDIIRNERDYCEGEISIEDGDFVNEEELNKIANPISIIPAQAQPPPNGKNNIVNSVNSVKICNNCGNVTTNCTKLCTEPVYSYGLICFFKSNGNYGGSVSGSGVSGIAGNSGNNISSSFMENDKKTKKKIIIKNDITSGNIDFNKIKILKRNDILGGGLKKHSKNTNTNDIESADPSDFIPDMEEEIMEGTTSKYPSGYSMGGLRPPPGFENIKPINSRIKPKNINTNTNGSVSNGEASNANVTKVILVQRMNTIGLAEFLRGKYEVNDTPYIIKLLNMMTFDEKKVLMEHKDYDSLRLAFGFKKDILLKSHYEQSKLKFHQLVNRKVDSLLDLILKSYTKWTSPEFGLPKGRRNNKEFDLECAVREFAEETGVRYEFINVYRNVKPLEEVYKSINGVVYKHIYYLASIKESPEAIENIKMIENQKPESGEIKSIKLATLSECHKLIRPYYVSKLNVIKKGFQLIGSLDYFFEM